VKIEDYAKNATASKSMRSQKGLQLGLFFFAVGLGFSGIVIAIIIDLVGAQE
jgi:hypothetical protein